MIQICKHEYRDVSIPYTVECKLFHIKQAKSLIWILSYFISFIGIDRRAGKILVLTQLLNSYHNCMGRYAVLFLNLYI